MIIEQQKRTLYLDGVKVFAIYLVLLGHLPKVFVGNSELMHEVIYSFHMPLFMILSGYFSLSSFKKNFRSLLKEKAVRLLVPTVSCTLLCVTYRIIRDEPLIWIMGEIVGNSWFLKTLFLCSIVVWYIKRLHVSDKIMFLLSSYLFFILPFASFLQFNWLYPFFWCGYFLRKHNLFFERYKWDVFISCALIYSIAFVYKQIHHIPVYLPITWTTITNQFYIHGIRFVLGFSGSLFIIVLIKIIFEKTLFLNGIAQMGKYTLEVYVIQNFILDLFMPSVLCILIDNSILLHGEMLLGAVFLLVVFLKLRFLISKQKMLDKFLFGW